jgi:hypothetical protein
MSKTNKKFTDDYKKEIVKLITEVKAMSDQMMQPKEH